MGDTGVLGQQEFDSRVCVRFEGRNAFDPKALNRQFFDTPFSILLSPPPTMSFDEYFKPNCPSWAPLLGFMGMAAAVVFSSKSEAKEVDAPDELRRH